MANFMNKNVRINVKNVYSYNYNLTFPFDQISFVQILKFMKMKRSLLISFMMLAIVSLSLSQPFATARQSAINGNQKSPGHEILNPSRSIPPGTLLYSNAFTCPPDNGLSSESWASSETAVDFVLPSNNLVNTVRWWFLMNADPATTNWIIRFYDNQDCFPDNLLYTWNIAAADVTYEHVCDAFGYPAYDMWTNLNPGFNAQAGQTYWISVQAVISESYRAFWSSGEYKDCTGAFRSVYFGSSDWISSITEAGISDFAFEIYTAKEVPVSSWALFIGIGLILVFTVVRFRKMV
jgi:hypothetical protein